MGTVVESIRLALARVAEAGRKMLESQPTLARVRGVEKTTIEFRRELASVAERLGCDRDHLAAVISFESAGTFSPRVRNWTSGAVGLIQFLPGTLERLGTTPARAAAMTAVQQLALVERYFAPVAGKLRRLADVYGAVIAPSRGIGAPQDTHLYEAPSAAYDGNRLLDRDRKGYITLADAVRPVQRILDDSLGLPRLPIF